MHISEGVLSIPVIFSGWAGTLPLLIISLRNTSFLQLPTMAVFASIFFLASLVRVPIGPTSAHFALLAIMGIMLGWGAFPAIFISLALQAILFQFGGIFSLGVNALTMGVPALIASFLFHKKNFNSSFGIRVFSGVLGSGSIFLATIFLYFALAISNDQFINMGLVLIIANAPLALLEGIITIFTVDFIHRVAPDILSFQTTCKHNNSY